MGKHDSIRKALGKSSFVKRHMAKHPIIAIGLLTASDLERLGPSFEHAWPVDDADAFSDLLAAIDDADREFRRERDRRKETEA